VGDFNGDGAADLAVTNYIPAGTVQVLKGNGDGTFQAAVSYSVGNAFDVAAADFDGDGAKDLAVTNYDSGTVSVLRNTGTGTFQPAVNYVVGGAPWAVAAGDLDADGHPDLAVTTNTSAGTVTVLRNDGIWGAGPQVPSIPPPNTRPPANESVGASTGTWAGTALRPLADEERLPTEAMDTDAEPWRFRPWSSIPRWSDDAWIGLFEPDEALSLAHA